MNTPSNNPITSPDWHEKRLEAIKRLYPDLFTDEGKISVDELQALAQNYDLSLGEKFEFRWPGKMHAKKSAFTASKARLAPDISRSLNFDETENVIIEGENLEVLKLLSKAYYNKVKCIYIDPPYNTGHDFVYSDDYSEDKQAYWEKNGVYHDAVKIDTNTESAGRYHTNWLNMMMPRLLLAQMMLKDDGVIFVSIDDNEVHNLRKLMDEVFGEENFVATFIWEKRTTRENRREMSVNHDYIVAYSKNRTEDDELFNLLPLTSEVKARYVNPDHDVRGVWQSVSLNAQAGHATPSQFYEIETPGGRKLHAPAGRCWSVTKERLAELIADNRIWFGEDGKNVPRRKVFLSEIEERGLTPHTLWAANEVGTTDSAKKELNALFHGKSVFDTPKPVGLIRRIVELAVDNEDLILDFFAGSGATAEAVMAINKEDGGHRKFVLVQLPEEVDEKSEAYKAGYKKISDITIERVKHAGERIHEEKPEVDTGFKVFKLTTSMFPENIYQPDPEKTPEENVQALKDHVARAKQQLLFDPTGKETDLLYETLVKQGFVLTMTRDQLDTFKDNTVWKVTDGDRSALVCLDVDIKESTITALEGQKDIKFIGLHRAVDTTRKWALTEIFGEALVLI